MNSNEKLLICNIFGTVTDKRVIINDKSATQEILIDSIKSVKFKHERNYFLSLSNYLIFILGLGDLISNINYFTGLQVLLTVPILIITILSGVANWIGHYMIQLNHGDKKFKYIKAEMSKKSEGRDFADAIQMAMK
jgi:hypothetical protein